MRAFVSGQAISPLTGSVTIEHRVLERSIARLSQDSPPWGHYEQGQRLVIEDAAGLRLFGGLIQQVRMRRLNDGLHRHELEATDWRALADRRLVAKAYANVTAASIVNDLIATWLAAEGVTAGTIETGPTIVEAVFNYVSAARALDLLAERTGYWWLIDPNLKLHFRARASWLAPWELTNSDALVEGLQWEEGNAAYRNRQYLRGGRDTTDPQVETFKGSNWQRNFTTAFPVAKVPTVKVNSVTKTVGIRGLDTGKDWYWSKDDSVISQDPAGALLQTTDTLEVTYQGAYDVVVLTYDQAEISRVQAVEGAGTGQVEVVDDEPNATGRDAALQIATGTLATYAKAGRRLRFRTRRAGLSPGHLLPVRTAIHPLADDLFLVESVTVRDLDAGQTSYEVVAIQGPAGRSWAALFGALAERGQMFVVRENIRQQEILIILQQTSEGWSWAESAPVTVLACPMPSTTTWPGTTVYPC